jgi:hypothetical protein
MCWSPTKMLGEEIGMSSGQPAVYILASGRNGSEIARND